MDLPFAEPYKIKMVESLHKSTKNERLNWIKNAVKEITGFEYFLPKPWLPNSILIAVSGVLRLVPCLPTGILLPGKTGIPNLIWFVWQYHEEYIQITI